MASDQKITLASFSRSDLFYIFTFGLMVFALFEVIHLGLLPALLGGLFVFQFTEFGSRLLERVGVIPVTGKYILLGAVTGLVVAAIVGLISVSIDFISSEGHDGLIALLQRMADALETARMHLPLWAQDYMPANMNEWQSTLVDWLRENAKGLGSFGTDIGKLLLHIIFGMIIGGLAALSRIAEHNDNPPPLSAELKQRAGHLDKAFTSVVFSQLRISAINTVFTALFLTVIMPLMGMDLPLTKPMIVVTFIAGLLPIIGNLISNTVITLIALSVSPVAAITSLGYLVIIHKLEYFLNAHIIGHHIRSKVWEVLLAMLVMESAFGIAGLVAAPIYYAYLKNELAARKLI